MSTIYDNLGLQLPQPFDGFLQQRFRLTSRIALPRSRIQAFQLDQRFTQLLDLLPPVASG